MFFLSGRASGFRGGPALDGPLVMAHRRLADATPMKRPRRTGRLRDGQDPPGPVAGPVPSRRLPGGVLGFPRPYKGSLRSAYGRPFPGRGNPSPGDLGDGMARPAMGAGPKIVRTKSGPIGAGHQRHTLSDDERPSPGRGGDASDWPWSPTL